MKNMIIGTINMVDRLHSSGDDRGVNKWTWGMINRICSVCKTVSKVEKKIKTQKLLGI